jgi:hypothetical protein
MRLIDDVTNSPITEITTIEDSENNPNDKTKSVLPFYNCEIVKIIPNGESYMDKNYTLIIDYLIDIVIEI